MNPNFTSFIKPVRKLLQYCRFEHIDNDDKSLSVFLSQILQLLVTIKGFVQEQNDDDWRLTHERSYIKLLCAFMRACGSHVDLYSPGSSNPENFLDGAHNTLISDLQEDSLLFIIYSQYVRTLSQMGNDMLDKLRCEILPAVMESIIEELDLSDQDRLSEEQFVDPETGDVETKMVANITKSDAHRAITCISHIAMSLQSEEASTLLAPHYEDLMLVLMNLLDKCLLTVGDIVMDTLGNLFNALKYHSIIDQDIQTLADILLPVLKQQYTGDKIHMIQMDKSNEQDESEEIVDMMSNATFSIIGFLDSVVSDDVLLPKCE